MRRLREKMGLLCLMFVCHYSLKAQQNQMELWYDKPAANWNEALPIGNGFLAGMIF
ncbi:hypothetical protein EIM50_19495, partial [Pseudoxanthomonas sp. SGD-10]